MRGALVALMVGSAGMARGANEDGEPWYRGWLKALRPGMPLKDGPASVYTPRAGKRGMIFRDGWQAEAKPAGLPELSPELSNPGYVWSLDTAISRALLANPTIVEAKLMVQRQASLLVEAGSRRLPQVAVTGMHDWRDPGLLDAGNNVTVDPRTTLADRSYDVRLEVRQLLYDHGGISATVRREKIQNVQTKMALQLAAYRTVSLVKQHYDAVLYREATLANAQRRERSIRQVAEFTERRWKLGEQPELENLRAATELKLAQADVVRAQRDLQQVRIGFARQLYLPAASDPETAYVLSGELTAADFTLPRDEAMGMAIARRLDLQTAQLQLEIAGEVLKAVRSDAFPKIEATAGYGYRSSYYRYDRQLDGWTLGVSGRWPIFDGNAVRARTQAYRAEQRVAQVRLEDMELKVKTEVAELYAGLDLARTALAAQKEAVVLAEKSLAQARRGYELGQATLEQVLEIENVLLRSQNAYAEAVLSLNATVAQLEYGVGGVLPGTRDVGIEVMP
ncbi:MAG TPA: TolC family protein [Opitutaceae bacterium]|nr:TolC family protein [Opitutaceae bacterium]